MEKLTIQQQIDSLEKSLKYLKYDTNPFVCVDVTQGIRDVINKYVSYREATDYIPLLTFENAEMVCRKYKLKMPNKECMSGGWWNAGIRKPRLAFVNWMIKELKKEIQDGK